MPPIVVKHVISFTSQDPKHTVRELVEGRGAWLKQKTDKSTSLRADLQLEKATQISYIDIGNAGSVMIGLEVGRSAWPLDRPYVTLIPSQTFMTRAEVFAGQNRNTVHMFNSDKMDETSRKEEWDRVRIVCVQPYPCPNQFGISMLKMYSESKATPKSQSCLLSDFSLGVSVNKKDELLAKLKFSSPDNKPGLSDRIKKVEPRQLPEGGGESVRSQHASSPLSRGARLVTHAAKLPSQQDYEANKTELEQESLRFLMSLNLSVSEIDQLSIKVIRQKFEKKREEPLTFAEIKIFKAIAVDYARRRLEILEKQDSAGHLASRGVRTSEVPAKTLQHKRKREHTSTESRSNNEFSNGLSNQQSGKSAISSSESKRELPLQESKSVNITDQNNQDIDKPNRKFTFGQSKYIDSPASVQSQETLETQSSKAFKNFMDRKRAEGRSSGNALSLLGQKSDVQTPKRTKARKPRTPKPVEEHQSKLGKWITPANKLKTKEKKKEFQHSSLGLQHSDNSGSDIESISEEDSAFPSTPRGKTRFREDASSLSLHWSPLSASGAASGAAQGSRLGAPPSNRYNTVMAEARPSMSPSNQKQQLVMCPLCPKSFHVDAIEAHAASCSIASDNESGDDNNTQICSDVQPSTSTSGLVEECPVCGVQVAAAVFESHATQCATSAFG